MAKKKKAKLRVGRVILCATILVAIVVGIVFLVTNIIPKCSLRTGTDTTTGNIVTAENPQPQEGEYLKILQDSCNAYVGTVFLLHCEANPTSLLQNVRWSTTNEKILTVSDSGRVEVVGLGTAAIVAVSGIYSDTVIICGIASDDEKNPDYPVVDESSKEQENQPTNSDGEPVNPEDGQPGKDENPSDYSSEDPTENSNEQPFETEEGEPTNHTEPSSDSASESSDEASRTPSATEDYEVVEPTSQQLNHRDGEECKSILSQKAEELGFTRYAQGTYIFEEDGNYLGEMILENDKFQLCVKTRTSLFDRVAKELLQSVLPNSYEQAYALLLDTGAIDTVVLDGMRVRAVIPSNPLESHKQLIIYY